MITRTQLAEVNAMNAEISKLHSMRFRLESTTIPIQFVPFGRHSGGGWESSEYKDDWVKYFEPVSQKMKAMAIDELNGRIDEIKEKVSQLILDDRKK